MRSLFIGIDLFLAVISSSQSSVRPYAVDKVFFNFSRFFFGVCRNKIVIRKVLGARASEIVILLSKDFSRWVLLANLFAWPAAYYTSEKWLQGFAYRNRLGVGPFLWASVSALLVALLTISFQSIKAATANPVDAIRHE